MGEIINLGSLERKPVFGGTIDSGDLEIWRNFKKAYIFDQTRREDNINMESITDDELEAYRHKDDLYVLGVHGEYPSYYMGFDINTKRMMNNYISYVYKGGFKLPD